MKNEEKKYIIEDGQHKNEVIVSWIITHCCQERCSYCISPNQSQEIKSFEEHLKIQNQMIDSGLTKNRYIGGEPLTVQHLLQLVKEASLRNVNTRISTNGILLTKEKLLFVRDYINSFAFPFESTNAYVNEKVRGSKNHSDLVTNRIKMVKDLTDAGVLVNTCVHKENIDYLFELGYHLNELGIDHWKLRKFYSGSGRGAVPNKDRFDISKEEFLNIVNKLKEAYPEMKIDGRLPSKLQTRLMLSPQGILYRMAGEGDDENVIYGNVLTKKLKIKEIYERDKCN